MNGSSGCFSFESGVKLPMRMVLWPLLVTTQSCKLGYDVGTWHTNRQSGWALDYLCGVKLPPIMVITRMQKSSWEFAYMNWYMNFKGMCLLFCALEIFHLISRLEITNFIFAFCAFSHSVIWSFSCNVILSFKSFTVEAKPFDGTLL